MANWIVSTRTNYVGVNVSDDEIVRVMGDWEIETVRDSNGRYMFYPCESEGQDWPYSTERAGVAFSIEDHIMPYVVEGDALVIMTVGSEKLRYLSGFAEAFVRYGDEVQRASISLEQIYDIAKDKFGGFVNITLCED